MQRTPIVLVQPGDNLKSSVAFSSSVKKTHTDQLLQTQVTLKDYSRNPDSPLELAVGPPPIQNPMVRV